jgi:hypothetical protein
MDGVNIPTDNIPAELKACDQILKRAKELKKAEPVVAYWCKLLDQYNHESKLTFRLFLCRSKGLESPE